MKQSTLGDLRAAVARLGDLSDDTPITVLYDSDYGEAHGIDVLGSNSYQRRDGSRSGVTFSISDFHL